jgi:hypothetical protein
VQQQAGDVDRRLAQLRCHAVGQHPERVVGGDQVAVAVDDHRRVGEVAVQDPRQRGADRVELGVVEAGFLVGGGVARREEEGVAFPKGHLQRLGHAHDHGPTRDRAATLDEADVPLGGAGAQGELQLADATAPAPHTQPMGELAVLRLTSHATCLALRVPLCHSLEGIAQPWHCGHGRECTGGTNTQTEEQC